ncbi:helix-turn-helix domain-containing protein [Vibrio cholerae]|uniref:helix-turn-helix domain-containing protein n=1 Tax=Vibrio cholerae TaxID=666 RepID=UPI0018F0D898|nr:AraC family transcriptional regulator [Vibrio cholerae]MBJ7016773.1 helix-turn-helix transcriptional regulator [Vibrio cholerae]
MQNRTSVMGNEQKHNKVIMKHGARHTVTLVRHVIAEHSEQIVAQSVNQPVMAQGHFIEYTSPTGFTLHGGSSHELADCDVMTTSAPALVIILLLEGTLRFAYDNHKFELCANEQPQAMMVNLQQPCIFHRRIHQGMSVRKLNIILAPDKLQPFAQQECPLHHFMQQDKALVPLSLNEESWQAVESLLNNRVTHTISAHIAREATVWRLVHDAVLQCPEHATSLSQHQEGQPEQWINQLLHYIDQHLHEEICLEQLAERHAMSVSNLQRKFKTRLNMTIAHYIRHRRLQLARQQLERGLVTITEAAYEAGYLHPSNFTAAFKKAFGISPQAFVELKQAG